MLVAVAMALTICLPGMANALYIEHFDTNNAGWLADRISGSTITTPSATYNTTGGDPDGYISGSVNNTATRLYGFQPAFTPSPYTTFGNLTGAYLTTDFKSSGTVSTSTPEVRFYIGKYVGTTYNYFVTKDAYSWNPNSDTSWTTHNVFMNASNFMSWPNQNAGTITFANMLSQYNDIGLVFNADSLFANANLGFSSTGGATLRVDNFGSSPVPLPPSVLLLGTGILGLVGLGWRRRKTS
jgi:hypothetical protein